MRGVEWTFFCVVGLAVLAAGCGSLVQRWEFEGAEPGLRRGPYLQSVTQDSIWLLWETHESISGRVEYGPTPELGLTLEPERPSRRHQVRLTGLEPGRRYYYRVNEGPVSSFRTAPSAADSRFRMAVFGDTRSDGRAHRAIVEGIVREAPDLALHTGDLVELGRLDGQWDDFFHIEAPLLKRAPLYPTLGNHELESPLYLEAFHLPGNELWYAFDYGNARLICLKADGYPEGVYFPQADQLAWLEQELVSTQARWVFVFFHLGVYTSRDDEFLELGLRKRLAPLFERHRVDAVFMGHNHGYERVEVNDTLYLTAAGGGAPLYELKLPEPGSRAAYRAHHYVILDVEGDMLRGRAVDRDGQVIDQFTRLARRW